MTTWIATLSHDLSEDKPFKEIELEANSEAEALDNLNSQPLGAEHQHYSLLNIRKKRGGVRPGAGRPKGTARAGTYGTGIKTKPVRVPEHLAEGLPELLANLEQLKDLLADWETEAAKSTSPRYDRARKLLQEIRALGF